MQFYHQTFLEQHHGRDQQRHRRHRHQFQSIRQCPNSPHTPLSLVILTRHNNPAHLVIQHLINTPNIHLLLVMYQLPILVFLYLVHHKIHNILVLLLILNRLSARHQGGVSQDSPTVRHQHKPIRRSSRVRHQCTHQPNMDNQHTHPHTHLHIHLNNCIDNSFLINVQLIVKLIVLTEPNLFRVY